MRIKGALRGLRVRVVRVRVLRGACVVRAWCVCVVRVVRVRVVRGAWWCVVRVRVRGAVVTAFHGPNQNMDAL